MNTIRLKQALFALALAGVAFNSSADWALNNSESSLNFISLKKLTIGEVHGFKSLKGSLKDNGNVSVDVSLMSVDTKIPTRDERIKKVLFEVSQFPQATVSTKVDVKRIKSLKSGESFLQTVALNLSIHGEQQTADAEMRITSLADNKLLASTIKPIIINARDFKLVKGIEMLQELAKLPSIDTAIPVSASFIFEK